jgi:uncharacterized caspase-like protein
LKENAMKTLIVQAALSQFAKLSSSADVAVVYTSGHGVEVEKTDRLLLGDFALAEGRNGLADHSVDVPTIASASRARKVNLVFYGACRNDPF